MTSSFNVSGLLGGTAGSIDTVSLIASLMQGAAVPQTILKDHLTALTNVQNAYQAINTQTAMMQSAAHNVTDAASWNATTAVSSSSSVVASSAAGSSPGTTTFNVTRLAQSQVDTIAADSDGNVVSDPDAGITITGADGDPVTIDLTSGDAASVASAINAKAGLGLRASVVTTDTGTRLQLSSAKTGSAGAFTSAGFITPAVNVTAAQDAQVTVGNTGAGGSGYTVSSSSNTFTGLVPGVTFSVNALANNVAITVVTDQQSISDKVKSLVSAANSLGSLLSTDSSQGGILQGRTDARALANGIMSSVSHGTAAGTSLSTYGIDMDKFGVLTFDATKFASAFAADPAGTQSAIAQSFGAALNTAADNAIAPITGSVTQALSSGSTQAAQLNTEIDNWTTKLATIQTGFQQKFSTMQTIMSKLQSQQTYLTSMLKSLDSSSSSSS